MFACVASGCVVSPDFSGTSFLCQKEPICPAGYECVSGVCEPQSGEVPDASVVTAGFRRPVVFDNSGRGVLTNMPVMVELDPDSIEYDTTSAGGTDVHFRDLGGNILPHEIESWNPGGVSVLWVKVPSIGAGATSESIWLHYGDSSFIAEQQPAELWSDYRAVYHMTGSGDGTVRDSTASGFDGVANGGAVAAGTVGDARTFDGMDDCVNLGADRSYADGATAVTTSGWVRPGNLANQVVAFGASINGGTGSRVQIVVRPEVDALILNGGGRTQDGGDIITIDGGQIPTGVWTWYAMTMDLPANTITIYFNGAQVASANPAVPLDAQMPETPSTQAVIGCDENLTSNFWVGDLDEIRIATELRSADYISAQYASMTSAFVTIGDAEEL